LFDWVKTRPREDGILGDPKKKNKADGRRQNGIPRNGS